MCLLGVNYEIGEYRLSRFKSTMQHANTHGTYAKKNTYKALCKSTYQALLTVFYVVNILIFRC